MNPRATSTVQCRGLVPGIARGALAVAREPLIIGRIDTRTGRLQDAGHSLHGRLLAGSIVCMPWAHGSSTGSYILLNLAAKGLAPAGLVMGVPDAVAIAGAVLAGIPLLAGISADTLAALRDQSLCSIDGETGILQLCD